MATKVNIEIEQGATFTTTQDLLNADGTDFDVTGYTGTGSIRKHYLSNTAYSMNVALSNGSCTFSMTAANTASLDEGLYVYDVKITSGNTIHRVFSGMVTVSPSVTD